MFRPCIDLHEGKVKQIVGGTLSDNPAELRTNSVSEHSSAWFAELYKRDGLKGGHVIMLGSGNEQAAREFTQILFNGIALAAKVHPRHLTSRAPSQNGSSHSSKAAAATSRSRSTSKRVKR